MSARAMLVGPHWTAWMQRPQSRRLRRQAFVRAARDRARRQGFTVLEPGSGPIDLLLLKRDERVAVISGGSRLALGGSRAAAQQLGKMAHCDAVWTMCTKTGELVVALLGQEVAAS